MQSWDSNQHISWHRRGREALECPNCFQKAIHIVYTSYSCLSWSHYSLRRIIKWSSAQTTKCALSARSNKLVSLCSGVSFDTAMTSIIACVCLCVCMWEIEGELVSEFLRWGECVFLSRSTEAWKTLSTSRLAAKSTHCWSEKDFNLLFPKMWPPRTGGNSAVEINDQILYCKIRAATLGTLDDVA